MKTFNPKQVAVIVDTIQCGGFASDMVVEIEFDEDAFSMEVGVDGEGTRVQSNNNAATIKIHLMQTSATNDLLSALAASDRVSQGGLVSTMVKDNSGRTVALAKQSFIKKMPPWGAGRKANVITWEIRTDNLIPFWGGN